jgi:hypothetical protein
MILQKVNSNNCGPVSIINAFYNLYGHFPNCNSWRLAGRLETNNEFGTEPWMMEENGLIKLGKMIFRREKILELEKFIILYIIDETLAHYVFVERTGNEYYVYNYTTEDDRFVNKSLNGDEFEKEFFKYRRDEELDYPIAWKIEK